MNTEIMPKVKNALYLHCQKWHGDFMRISSIFFTIVDEGFSECEAGLNINVL